MQKLPSKLYLAEQVKKIEQIAIEERGITGFVLMTRACMAVFDAIQKNYPAAKITVFCGAGNNAGDGYIVAKLALIAGYSVIVYYLSNPKLLKGDALLAYQDYVQNNGKSIVFNNEICITEGIIVDAMFGTGLNRKVSGEYVQAIEIINKSSVPVVAIDIPSGLNADTGDLMGCCVSANITISFIGLKQGLFTGFAAECCGRVMYYSLGLPDELIDQVDCSSRLQTKPLFKKRHRCAHKGDNGHVLIIGGETGFSGATRLAAEAALRIGAGLVSVATRNTHSSFINLTRPELMCHGIEHAEMLIPLINKATVIVIGPGLGQTQWAKDLLQKTVESGKKIICDADALNLIANENNFNNNWVLTPHPGEAARLLSCSTAEIGEDRFKAVTEIQNNFGGIVVLKGAGTLITNGKEMTVSTTGNPGMATAGMGDTLAGMIAGLVAQNQNLYTAAKTAVYLHGQAADLAAEKDGEIGLLASDLMPYIRTLVNS